MLREELPLDCAGMLPATECSTRMMALTRAGWELINLQCRKGGDFFFSSPTGAAAPYSRLGATEKSHSQVQHVRVCELDKEVFVLQDPWTDTKRRSDMPTLT